MFLQAGMPVIKGISGGRVIDPPLLCYYFHSIFFLPDTMNIKYKILIYQEAEDGLSR